MKILLDECVTKRLKPYIKEHEVFSVSEMRWNGIKNGKLMALCVENGFDVLLTIDKNLMYQQNLDKHAIIIVVLNSINSKLEELVKFIDSFQGRIETMQKYNAYLIEKIL